MKEELLNDKVCGFVTIDRNKVSASDDIAKDHLQDVMEKVSAIFEDVRLRHPGYKFHKADVDYMGRDFIENKFSIVFTFLQESNEKSA